MGDLFSGPHIILIVLVVLLLFGGKKIPELMRGLGRGIREFKDAKDNVSREIEDHMNDDRKTTTGSSTNNSTTKTTTTTTADHN
ncbi:MAG TPA: twin-arginine translocase TatA/TatE family subunit [Puia sp.]|nr:twin-arginine translocase TatA/TatE family subunit [Puia sp.]